MKRTTFLLLCLLMAKVSVVQSQLPDPVLLGYWHNWNDVNAPYIPLDQVDSRYNTVAIAFATPQASTDYKMEFIPDASSNAAFLAQVQTLQSQGRKVIISIGGATAAVRLDNVAERDTFVATMTDILTTFGFDGLDIDFEGSSVTVTGGTISNPVDSSIVNLRDAIRMIMQNYSAVMHRHLLLTMAPETAFVQGGMSYFGSIWGAYLPLIDALRDSLDLLQVQLYNSGSMYGIDGTVYNSGSADFIVAMTEAVIQGFNTPNGGHFNGLSPSQVAVGLPSCSLAAGSGYIDTATVAAAVNYLRGMGPRPGSYQLVAAGGYPNLRGMMTWSINWDAAAGCGAADSYASNFEHLFGTVNATTSVAATSPITVSTHNGSYVVRNTGNAALDYSVFGADGKLLLSGVFPPGNTAIDLRPFASALCYLRCGATVHRLSNLR